MSDDLRALVSSRNLTTFGGFDSPLEDFIGILKDADVKANPKFPDRNNVLLRFTELEVIRSKTPWTQAVCELSLPHSTSTRSRWGYFAASCNQFIQEDQDWWELIGHKLHLTRADKPIWSREKGQEVPTSVWEVVEVDGAGTQVDVATGSTRPVAPTEKPSARSIALRLLDGKTAQEFNSQALRDKRITGDMEMQNSIIAGTFLTSTLASGLVTKDQDGRYHVEARLMELMPT